MNRCMPCKFALVAAFCIVATVGSLVFAQYGKDKDAKKGAPAGQPEMKLPAGWTAEDMQACIYAMTPGQEHKWLAKNVGTWDGKVTMWMAPDTEPMKSECVTTVTPMLDGRFIKAETKGEMPGMGPFNGFGIYGFDNVSKKYQTTWIDNCGTGMMTGSGEVSSDGKVLTLTCNYNCPVAKKQIACREIETWSGPDSKTMVMYGPDPKTGKEFKSMEIVYTRKGGAGNNGTAEAPTERTR